jgi:elongation factor P--beta-lysine ligase
MPYNGRVNPIITKEHSNDSHHHHVCYGYGSGASRPLIPHHYLAIRALPDAVGPSLGHDRFVVAFLLGVFRLC